MGNIQNTVTNNVQNTDTTINGDGNTLDEEVGLTNRMEFTQKMAMEVGGGVAMFIFVKL